MVEVDMRPLRERQYDTSYIFKTLPSENEMSQTSAGSLGPFPAQNETL